MADAFDWLWSVHGSVYCRVQRPEIHLNGLSPVTSTSWTE
jgi:hypothetical protein